jgi:hypothetical protein
MQVTPRVTVGKKQVKLTTPSHVPGVTEGNENKAGEDVTRRPGRSTGINAKDHEPIDPAMPRLTPA